MVESSKIPVNGKLNKYFWNPFWRAINFIRVFFLNRITSHLASLCCSVEVNLNLKFTCRRTVPLEMAIELLRSRRVLVGQLSHLNKKDPLIPAAAKETSAIQVTTAAFQWAAGCPANNDKIERSLQSNAPLGAWPLQPQQQSAVQSIYQTDNVICYVGGTSPAINQCDQILLTFFYRLCSKDVDNVQQVWPRDVSSPYTQVMLLTSIKVIGCRQTC